VLRPVLRAATDRTRMRLLVPVACGHGTHVDTFIMVPFLPLQRRVPGWMQEPGTLLQETSLEEAPASTRRRRAHLNHSYGWASRLTGRIFPVMFVSLSWSGGTGVGTPLLLRSSLSTTAGSRDAMSEELPEDVRRKLHQYREANLEAQSGYLALCDAARRGDGKEVSKLEAGRDARRLAQDKTRRELDEAIRSWT
jgi:hypothetical protein